MNLAIASGGARRWGVQRGAAALAFVLAGAANAGDYPIKSVRWQEDYSYLSSSARAPEGLEALKFITLSGDKSSRLTLGGEVRVRVDDIQNAAFSLRPGGDYISTTTRLLFLTDWHLGAHARVFLQLGYHDEAGRKPAARSFDESSVDLQQAFAEWSFDDAARIRIGRQELPLGNQRLSEVREGGNIRRSFDGLRVDTKLASADIIAFWARPVLNREGAFDDRAIDGDAFYGVYAIMPSAALAGDIDLYYLTREKAASIFAVGTARETRSTLGARFSGSAAAWDWDGQLLGQWGSFGAESIRAYAATLEGGWTARAWA